LGLPINGDSIARQIDRFADEFVDEKLRHTVFSAHDFDAATADARLTQSAYLLLYELATDQLAPSAESFWSKWEEIARSLRR
jgi:hypothetical protein